MIYAIYAAELLLMSPIVLMALQIIVGLMTLSAKNAPLTSMSRPPCCIVIPAHNEAGGIVSTITSLQRSVRNSDKIVVIADNCSDDTAKLAKSTGVEVWERYDDRQRGKSYALHYAVVQIIRYFKYEYLVFIDADCTIDALSLDRLVIKLNDVGRPVQGCYVMLSGTSQQPQYNSATFFWWIRNVLRARAADRFGAISQIYGSGMALSINHLSLIEIDKGHLAEDMKMGCDLAIVGKGAVFCPDAIIVSFFASSEAGQTSQRSRWISGHFAIIKEYVPCLVGIALRSFNPAVLLFALDVAILPLSAGILLAGSMVIFGALVSILMYDSFAVIIPAVIFSVLVIAILAAARVYAGMNCMRFKELISLPRLARQFIHSLSYFVSRPKSWVRTERGS